MNEENNEQKNEKVGIVEPSNNFKEVETAKPVNNFEEVKVYQEVNIPKKQARTDSYFDGGLLELIGKISITKPRTAISPVLLTTLSLTYPISSNLLTKSLTT